MKNLSDTRVARERRGAAALVAVLFLSMLLASFALAGLSVTGRSLTGASAHREQLASRYAAEAGLAQAIFSLRTGGPAALGSEEEPVEFGGHRYWVSAAPLGDDELEVVAAGHQNHLETRIEATLRFGAPLVPQPAIFALDGLRLDSNAMVDSYDAGQGTYESQVENHSGSHYASDEGTVSTNGSITLAATSAVHGDATPGPEGSVTLLSNSTVSGATLPAEDPIELDPIEVPPAVSTGDFTVIGSTEVSLPAGVHAFDRLHIESNSKLTIAGPATVIVEDFGIESNSQFLLDTTLGKVEIYVASDFLMGSNTLVSPLNRQPTELAIFLSSDNMTDPEVEVALDETAFESNARLYGTLYAPNAFIEIDSNFQLFGSLFARRVHLDSYARVHFDEQLSGGDAGDRVVEVLSWRIASRRVNNPFVAQ